MKFSKVAFVFLVSSIMFLSNNSWAVQYGVVNMQSSSGVSDDNRLHAVDMNERDGCSGKALKFYNSSGWNDVNYQDIHLWSGDMLTRQAVGIAHNSDLNEPLLYVSNYDNGDTYICVNNSVRFILAAKIANSMVGGAVKAVYTTGSIVKQIFVGSAYVTGVAGAALTGVSVPIIPAAIAGGSVAAAAVSATVYAYLPEADEFIKNNLYLWYGDSSERTFGNVSARDICSASGSNWLQKIFIEYRLGWLDSFCQNYDNEANLTLNTSSDTATLTSNVPLHSNGAKTLTVSFSQAGVTSAQVRSGIGQGYGGNANGGPEGTGSGYDPDPNGDTWAGYDHHVGLKYMKIGKKSSGNWDGSKVWSIDDIPNRRDFRVKLKKKGGVWPDVCAEVWFTHNKYFTDDDWHLNTECKNLSDSQYDDYDYKSVYVKDVYIPNEMEAGKNYYFFTRVTYPGGVNPSSRSTNDEYIKVEIIDFSSEFEVDTVIGEVPLGVFFTNKSKLIKNDSVNESITYHWDFGDGTTSSEENPAHLYETTGTYTARLTTAASWGEIKTSQTKVVTVIEPEKQGLSTAQKMEILW